MSNRVVYVDVSVPENSVRVELFERNRKIMGSPLVVGKFKSPPKNRTPEAVEKYMESVKKKVAKKVNEFLSTKDTFAGYVINFRGIQVF